MDRFAIEETYTDDIRVVRDLQTGEELATLTHDDLGWSGMDYVEQLVERINRALR